MRKAILYCAGDLRIEEHALDVDALLPNQAYVETEVTALSTGTDLGNYLGHSTFVPGAPAYPRAVGYSNVGVIRRVGAEFDGRRSDRVFSMKPHQSAYIAGPNDLLVRVPDAVSPEQASLAYLTQLGLAALQQARYQPGENVAVVGLGVIGLCTAAVARMMGAGVVAIGRTNVRLAAAQRVGAHSAWLSADPDLLAQLETQFRSDGADIVVLTANTWDAWRLAMRCARLGGRVCVLGLPCRGQPPPDFNPLDPAWLYAKHLTILGSGWSPVLECSATDVRFNLRRNLEYILQQMQSGDIAVESLVSHHLPAARMREAYELAKEHSPELIAAVFDWRYE
jgi:threonine dehydrogenase-like Zn-dependent dehydrogenase